MPLQVLPAAGAADMYRCAVIERRAYATYPASKILFPGPLPADVLTKRGKELEARCEQPDSFFFKVVDTESESEEEQMIAFSIWTVFDGEDKRGKTASATAAPRRELPPGSNAEACEKFFGSLAELKKRNIGDRPHISLNTLNTDPKHNRRGSGTLLLQWGLEEAAKRGLPIYLTAAEQGHLLYLKHGFQDLEKLVNEFDGLEELNYNWAMIKEP